MKLATSMRILGFAMLLVITSNGVAKAQAISDTKIQAFITAALSVNTVIEEWTPRIEGAGSQEAADDLILQANAEVEAVIEATEGISPQEYREIHQAYQSDPELSARIEKIYEQNSSQ